MKLLHREDVEEAGYDMPNTGICANIPEFDLEELKFAGEWVLADDEVVVSDGHGQHHLYVVVSGQVDVYKQGDQVSQSQHIANIAAGDAFGEMAFLSGGVASADVQATGQVVLWRIDHDRLLEFVGQHRAGGQLCMNVASILSTRLVDGNRKLVGLGKQLEDSLRQVRVASTTSAGNDKALRRMQSEVKGVTRAFAGKEVAQTKMGGLGIAATVVAGISLVGLIVSFATRPDSAAEEQVVVLTEEKDDLARAHGKLAVENDELKDAKARLLSQNRRDVEGLRDTNQRLLAHSDELVTNQKGLIAKMTLIDREKAEEEEEKLAEIEKNRPPERPPAPLSPEPEPEPENASVPRDVILGWARQWSLAFPVLVKAVSPVTLQAGANAEATTRVGPGKSLYALRIQGEHLLVGLNEAKNKFMQWVPVGSTNFVEAVTPRYKAHAKLLADRAKNTPTEGSPFTKPPVTNEPPPDKKPPANDHGNSCVCPECRKKKKGGSLFPDLPGQ